MTHAHQSIAARIAQLPELSMDSLWALWDEHFDERPNHHHRTWIESRLAYKIQDAIEHLTGCAVYRIEGDLPEGRADVFGLKSQDQRSPRRKFIPIEVSNA